MIPGNRFRAARRWQEPFLYTDDFNRTSGLGSNWWRFASWPGTGDYPIIYQNQWSPQGGNTEYKRRHGSVWKTPVPVSATNYYVQATMAVVPSLTTANQGMGVIVGANDTSDHSNTDGPQAVFCTVITSGWYVFVANTGGLQNTNTVIATLATGSGSFTSGGVIRAEVLADDNLTVRWNGMTLVSDVNINGYRSGKKVGLVGALSTSRIDDFTASNL